MTPSLKFCCFFFRENFKNGTKFLIGIQTDFVNFTDNEVKNRDRKSQLQGQLITIICSLFITEN